MDLAIPHRDQDILQRYLVVFGYGGACQERYLVVSKGRVEQDISCTAFRKMDDLGENDIRIGLVFRFDDLIHNTVDLGASMRKTTEIVSRARPISVLEDYLVVRQ